MKIALFTNTYLPHVGGVAKSVSTLAAACRQMGHEVRIVAPEFDDAETTHDVLRVPAIQHFNGSDFSVRIPIPNTIRNFIDDFEPDIIHSHHPFLLGDAALRVAWRLDVPIVFTHHTLYERYTHYVPLDSPSLKRIAVQLSTEYCNLCDHVIAPSESVAKLLVDRGVETSIDSIPTGIDVEAFSQGNGTRFRQKHGIAQDAKVIGTVGRLAKEKNLTYLAEAVAQCLRKQPDAHFLVVGEGSARDEMLEILHDGIAPERIYAVGKLTGMDLADAYAAMNWFAFASHTETQGLVLAEAMATGKPVVGLDASGVREILKDGVNGILLPSEASSADFSDALSRLIEDSEFSKACAEQARQCVHEYSTDACVRRTLACYEQLRQKNKSTPAEAQDGWNRFLTEVEGEWNLLVAKMTALRAALTDKRATEAKID